MARQALYAFLTRVLAAPLRGKESETLSFFAGSDTPLGQAVTDLLDALKKADDSALDREYHDLFIGVGRGEMLPYASYYLTGFLNEKPLAELRRNMKRLGFARAEGVKEPEDHIASLCDVMSHLIEATQISGGADIYEQDRFFSTHIKPWAGKFFADLKAAKSADTYRHIGRIGEIFMTIEEGGFAMIARA